MIVYGLKPVMMSFNSKILDFIYDVCYRIEEFVLTFATSLYYVFYTTSFDRTCSRAHRLECIVDRLSSEKHTIRKLWFKTSTSYV